jgi:diguanylate cyclase (GGDEF)-like protein
MENLQPWELAPYLEPAVVDAIAETSDDAPAGPGNLIRTDTVLVADDDAISRKMLESCLRNWKMNVTTAKDGLYAWHELQKPDAPSMIVLDWMMPGLSGIELCRRIRARKAPYYPYVLLLTSRDGNDDLVAGLDAGADDYLTKPFNVSELKARLQVGRRILQLQNELLRKEDELRFRASHDHLTGLWNRGAIFGFMEREVERGRRSAEPLGVLLVDIDHFKSVNDRYGHPAGDAVLRELGQRLRHGMRSYDWAGRYGGEEFLIVLSNCDPDNVAACAERLREAVASLPFHTASADLPVTVSIGTAVTSPEHPFTASQLVGLADEALYRAKDNGRNRVETGDPSVLAPLST